MATNKPLERVLRTALLFGTAALLLLTFTPQTLADGGGERSSSVKSVSSSVKSGSHHHGSHRGKYRGSSFRVHVGFPGYYYGPYGYYGYSRYGRYGHYGPYGHYGYYPYGYYGYGRSNRYLRHRFGALDLNVKPKDTQVWVNGGYVGTTGKLDGSPSMLWLEKDSYEVIFYKEGYETIVRNYRVTAGGVIKEKFEMQPGESKLPEDLSTAEPLPSPSAERLSETSSEGRVRDRPLRPSELRERSTRTRTLDVRQEPGKVAVHVTPKDASVYLDGQFIGIAKDLRRNPILLVDPGEHRVEIVHPGYESKKVEISVEAGKEQEVEVNLMKKERGDV